MFTKHLTRNTLHQIIAMHLLSFIAFLDTGSTQIKITPYHHMKFHLDAHAHTPHEQLAAWIQGHRNVILTKYLPFWLRLVNQWSSTWQHMENGCLRRQPWDFFLFHCDAIERQRYGSTLVKVIALGAPSHYLNQCRFLIIVPLWLSQNVFENYAFKITATLPMNSFSPPAFDMAPHISKLVSWPAGLNLMGSRSYDSRNNSQIGSVIRLRQWKYNAFLKSYRLIYDTEKRRWTIWFILGFLAYYVHAYIITATKDILCGPGLLEYCRGRHNGMGVPIIMILHSHDHRILTMGGHRPTAKSLRSSYKNVRNFER